MVAFTEVGHQCNANGDPPLQTSKPLFLRKTASLKVFTIALMTDTASAPWFYWQIPYMPTFESYIGRYRAYTVNGRVSANVRILHWQIRYLSICTSKFLRIHLRLRSSLRQTQTGGVSGFQRSTFLSSPAQLICRRSTLSMIFRCQISQPFHSFPFSLCLNVQTDPES